MKPKSIYQKVHNNRVEQLWVFKGQSLVWEYPAATLKLALGILCHSSLVRGQM
jgi:hypothetical protein